MVEGWRGKLEYWNGGKLVRSQEPVGEWNIGRLGSVSRVAIYCLYPIIPAFQHSSIPAFRIKPCLMLQMLPCPEGCLETIGNVDLPKDIVEVGLHRVRTEVKLVSNLFICGPHGDQGEDFDLPGG